MSTSAASGDNGLTLEVLVATMNRPNADFVASMNLKADAVVANQTEVWSHTEQLMDGHRIRMLSTATRGVGVNRNLALQLAEADILLFADDDIVYYDGALEAVRNAFRELPEADVIFFGIDMTKKGQIFDKRRNKTQRVHLWNSFKYGACRMAVRRDAIIKKRISFSTLFGGGCIYCSGEDSIFIRDCLRAGLKLYSHSAVLGACAKDTSTWFTGFNEKYFFDRGAMIACAFPRAKHLIKWYFILKLNRKSDAGMTTIVKRMNEGINAYRTLSVYREGN